MLHSFPFAAWLSSDVGGQLLPALTGLLGVALGAFLTSRSQRTERQQRFARDQISEFYAPLLSLRSRIRTKSEIRAKVHETAGAVWPRLMEEAREGGIDRLCKTREALSPAFQKIIEYDNQQLEEELLPLYRHMVEVFTSRLYLAEASTRQCFASLVEFVELWDRHMSGALPREVLKHLAPDEDALSNFYGDLETNFQRLQATLKE